ncbi:MAG: glycosyltransferase, partial [Phycisphaerales bacterium]|nr:glycosyltransferase [Phycisphaerales bacterium]
MKRYAYAIWTRVALFVIYTTSLFLYAVLGVVQRLTRRRGPAAAIGGNGAQRKYELLIIGTFYTRNWCISHVTPLARAANVSRVIAVVDGPTQAMPNVTYAYPPRWAARIMGRAFSKFFYALWIAMRRRPALIMGYHLLPGALTALLVARASGARSGYQVTAGPIELIGGGAATENFFLKNLRTNSRVIEMLACSLARRFDLIVVRGRSALEFMRERGLGRHVCIVPGSIDDKRFVRDGRARDIDVVSVCRLVPIKQPDHIVRVIARLARSRPDCRAVVLGEGPMRESLWALIRELGIERNIELRGHVDNVEAVLARAKTFLLTSRSEGLSIAMAEAMVAGAVPVVADVGDLGDLVSNGRTGWLVRGGDFDAYAARIAEVIRDGDRLATYSDAAHEAAVEHNGVRNIAERWTRTVEQVCGAGAESAALRTKQGVERMLWGLSRHKLWRWLPAGVKRTVDPVLRHVPTRWALGRRFRRESQWLEDVQWWSADQTRAYQVERLRALLGDAYERTTFYRQSFDAVGFHPRDFRSVDDLARLPLIDQETVRQSLDEMCTIRRFGVGVDQVSTGGTCGRPLKFYIGADRSAIEYAYLVSSWSRAGVKLGTA